MECSYERCPTGRPAKTAGLCGACYEYQRLNGTLARPVRDMEAVRHRRLLVSFTRGLPGECWLWPGKPTRKGYGLFRWTDKNGRRRGTGAHRAVYELLVGPVPDGLELDHTCRRKLCVNPGHLEPVTGAVNMERAKRPVCRVGHPWEGNELWRRNGTRTCRRCSRERIAQWKRDRRKVA